MYLILTAQTTIDFYENRAKAAALAERTGGYARPYSSPFDRGWRQNWQLVFGRGRGFWRSVLPSVREPPFPPWPAPLPVAHCVLVEPKQGGRYSSVV